MHLNWSHLLARRGMLQTPTDDDDRRLRAKQHCPPPYTMCRRASNNFSELKENKDTCRRYWVRHQSSIPAYAEGTQCRRNRRDRSSEQLRRWLAWRLKVCGYRQQRRQPARPGSLTTSHWPPATAESECEVREWSVSRRSSATAEILSSAEASLSCRQTVRQQLNGVPLKQTHTL